MLKEFTHGRLETAASQDKRVAWQRHFDIEFAAMTASGMYGDDFSIGEYVDLGEGCSTLKLQLHPLEDASSPPTP